MDQRSTDGRARSPRLSPAQAAVAAEYYPYAISMADRRARSADARWLDDRLRDAATTELFRAARMFAGTGGAPFKGYLGGCLRLKLSDTNLGRKARHRRVEELHEESAAVAPATSVDDLDSFEGLTRSLDPRSRAILKLTFWDDLSLSEIAERLGIGKSTVGATKDRALAALRGRLVMGTDGPRMREAV